jgi:cytochrome b pre-mRNA-processing protein 3
MGLFSFLRRENAYENIAITMYGAIVGQSRTATFYSELGVPDSLNGRFDMIVIHAMLAMRRLRAESASVEEPLSQELFDYMCKDMDRSFREVGVGDMSIGKHMKKMAKAFYGRAGEYEQGMDGDDAAFIDALKRNVYRASTPTDQQIQLFMQYLRAADKALATASFTDISAGRFPWPQVRVAV